MVRWSEEEETILVDTVLRRVREGSTQSVDFQEVAEQLGCTPQFCAFRWNHHLRRQHEATLNIAGEMLRALGVQGWIAAAGKSRPFPSGPF